MGHRERIIALLETTSGRPLCDDCISRSSGIQPRQAVNLTARALTEKGVIRRAKAPCLHCGAYKIGNTLIDGAAPPPRATSAAVPAHPDASRLRSAAPAAPPSAALRPSITEMRDHIVRFCVALAGLTPLQARGIGPTRLIISLREAAKVPVHESNMMQTLCNLRNVYSYQKIAFGTDEKALAEAAWAIVRAWAEKGHPALWRQSAR